MKNYSKIHVEILGKVLEVPVFTSTHSLIYKEKHYIGEKEEKELMITEEEVESLQDFICSTVLNSDILKEKILTYCNAIRKECAINLIEDVWQDLEIKQINVMKEENPYCKYYGRVRISLLGEIEETDPEHGISITFVNQKIVGIGQYQDFNKMYTFRYHKNAVTTGAFHQDQSVICDCCNKETDLYYEGPFYSIEDIDYLCPYCIGSGDATEKFKDLELIANVDKKLEGPDATEKNMELRCTPSYEGWQEEVWLTHCNDYCEFIGYVKWKDLQKEVYNFPHRKDRKKVPIIDLIVTTDLEGMSREELRRKLADNGLSQGYLFKCLHCEKYRLHIDTN